MTKPTKAMTIRLPRQLADQLTLVAQIDRLDVVEILRQAVAAHIASRIEDPAFRADAHNFVTDICLLIGETDA